MSILGNLKIVEQGRPTREELEKGETGPMVAQAGFYVHSVLGPGLEEHIYKECYEEELKHLGVPFARDVMFPMEFRGRRIEQAFCVDFVVGGRAIVFVIAEEKSELHNMQIRSLLKLSGMDEAYIVNFRVADMRSGIMRATLQKGNVLAENKARAATDSVN